MAGHLFVLQGDLTELSVDAWLLPGGSSPGPHFREAVGPGPIDGWPDKYGDTGHRVIRWMPLGPGQPQPYLTDVGGSRGTPVPWYVEGAVEFLKRAAADLEGKPAKNGRKIPLVGMPLVGTGLGGKAHEAGTVAKALLPSIYAFVQAHEIDVALVMIEGAAFSAVQAERRALFGDVAFTELEPQLCAAADRLAERARQGELVLFVGAGISASAGLPLWPALLDALIDGWALLGDDERAALENLSLLDRARLLESRLRPQAALGVVVAEHLRSLSSHYSLAHGLLAALPTDAVVTTNYDTLFEDASHAASRPVVILPYERASEAARWLLKLHGCVSRPGDIVLTRDDYLAYRDNRAALAGIVQALMITRHMLFVGFSLEDDNFHQIVRDVRRALLPAREQRQEQAPFATALAVASNPLAAELWRQDLDWVSLAEPGASVAIGARALEIVLDRLLYGASVASHHLFDLRYEGVLSPGERELKDRFEALLRSASPEARSTPAFAEIRKLYTKLGGRY